jgi:hypothetical protein
MNGDLILYKKMYDSLVWSFNKTDGFPKSKRFSISLGFQPRAIESIIKLKTKD